MITVDPMARIARALASQREFEARGRELSLYVAIGDSFTAGTGSGGAAWPEHLATALREINPSLELRNLATDGATSADVLAEQVPEALELEPDLVTVVCGGNDVLRTTRPDVERYGETLEAILERLRSANPRLRIATATTPERLEFLSLRPRTRSRVEEGIAALNRTTRRIAARRSIPCLEVAGHPALADPENYCNDGLHPSTLGHRRAGGAFASLLAADGLIELGEGGG